jgi:aspartate kinase
LFNDDDAHNFISKMKVFKFGGASVRNAEGVRNMASIVKSFSGDMIIVISAMGKTTNALEEIVKNYFNDRKDAMISNIGNLKNYHLSIVGELFEKDEPNPSGSIEDEFSALGKRLLATQPSLDFDFEYDQIVSIGEILSSKIANAYLNKAGISNKWIDIRKCLRTDDSWREGNIDWELSRESIPGVFNFSDSKLYITQGFIASTPFNSTTTLGREGSDYTAAIIANILDAESVTIWKDVQGIMNADPNLFNATQKLDELSYLEAVEMTYYGAKVIHPKTMKPLVEKNIPLYVRSFYFPDESGSVIHNIDHRMEYVPVFITKEDQVLITISPHDFSFMAEESIGKIYHLFSKFKIKVNLVQQSAMSFSLAIDHPERNFEKLINDLKDDFSVHYNKGLELLTIRYYNENVIGDMIKERTVYVEQRTRRTARFLLK